MSKKAIEDILSALDEIKDRLSSIELNNTEFQSKVEPALLQVRSIVENQRNLESALLKLNKISNDHEQHQRNFSVRVFNLPLTKEVSSDAIRAAESVYSVFKTIMEYAVKDKIIPSVPDMFSLIENSHILPSKGDSPNPVIVRFQSRLYRSLIFKYKRLYFKDHPASKVSIYEDLTGPNFQLLQSLKQDPSVFSAWSVGGRIKYKLKSAPEVTKSAYPDFSIQKVR